MRRAYSLLAAILFSLTTIWADGIFFTYDASKYSDETVIYLALTDALGTRMDYPNSCIGAFIGGECRDEAFATYDQVSGHTYYLLRVRGDADRERGQAITFRVMLQYGGASATGTGTRLEYWIDSNTPLATFMGDDRTTEISNPLLVTFLPITDISFKQEPIRVHRGQTLDLLSLIDRWVPGADVEGCLPQLEWSYDDYAANFFRIEGNNITGLKLTDEIGVELGVGYGGQRLRDVQVVVDLVASSVQWLEEYRLGTTVSVGDYETLNDILANGYVLTPADAVTTFLWESSNEEVVGFDRTNRWTPLKAGFAVLTGTALDGSGLTLTLNVTVIQPVTQVLFDDAPSGYMTAIVGEDITDRLNSHISVYPSDATNKEVRWNVDSNNTSVVWKNGRLVAAKTTYGYEGSDLLYAVAADGYGARAEVHVSVLPVQPTGLNVLQNPLYLSFEAGGTPVDVTSQIAGNVKVLPEEADDPYVWFDVANDGPSEVLQLRQTDMGVTIMLVGLGTCTVTAHVMTVDPVHDTEEELAASFQVVVRQGLSGFFVENVEMARGETVTVKLRAQPEGTSFDPSKVSLRVVPGGGQLGSTFPSDWLFATVTKSGSDGLTYTLGAQCLGVAGLVVSYDGQDMGWGTLSVMQRLTMADGWQWIALAQGQMDEPAMHDAFGANLSEIRSQEQLLINDSQQGYVGRLTNLDTGHTYKLRMTGIGSGTKTYDMPGSNYLFLYAPTGTEMSLRRGWNWAGNIYQYYQPVGSLFDGTSGFTSGDIIKCKNAFATFDGTKWQGTLRYLTPGEGMLVYMQNGGTVKFKPEFQMPQNLTPPQLSRAQSSTFSPQSSMFTIDGSRFDDNMAMIAFVGNVGAPSQVTLYAFVGDECRGRGEPIGDRQFITVHGQAGDVVTFKVYDPLTGCLHDVYGSRKWQPFVGSIDAPVSLYAGQISGIADVETVRVENDDFVYDLQGRKVGRLSTGLYIKNGKKVFVR